jgi:hypothetical protein
MQNTAAYLSNSSDVMQASSEAIPRENIKAFLLLERPGSYR